MHPVNRFNYYKSSNLIGSVRAYLSLNLHGGPITGITSSWIPVIVHQRLSRIENNFNFFHTKRYSKTSYSRIL